MNSICSLKEDASARLLCKVQLGIPLKRLKTIQYYLVSVPEAYCNMWHLWYRRKRVSFQFCFKFKENIHCNENKLITVEKHNTTKYSQRNLRLVEEQLSCSRTLQPDRTTLFMHLCCFSCVCVCVCVCACARVRGTACFLLVLMISPESQRSRVAEAVCRQEAQCVLY